LLLLNGKVYKTNINYKKSNEEELEYYRLIGEAYNSKQLDRASIKTDSKPGQAFYTYIVDGQPKTMDNTPENDKLYGYSK